MRRPPERVYAFPTISLEALREPNAADDFIETFDGAPKLMRAGDNQAIVATSTTRWPDFYPL